MGASASALPDKLSESDLQQLCGSNYNPSLYVCLKGDDNYVSKSDLFPILTDPLEQELFRVYLSFCENGMLDSKIFLDICRSAKLLSKTGWSSSSADSFFAEKSNGASVSYPFFRNSILPAIADVKETTVSKIIEKISKIEVLAESTATSSAVQPVDVTDEKAQALLKIQNAQRAKIAQKKVADLKELQQLQTSSEPVVVVDSQPREATTEEKCNSFFIGITPTGEMDSRQFILFCKNANLIEQKFTTFDCDLLFQKTKVTATTPGAINYASGVIMNKRITYDVFRAITIPLLAEKKKKTVDEILLQISTSVIQSQSTQQDETTAK